MHHVSYSLVPRPGFAPSQIGEGRSQGLVTRLHRRGGGTNVRSLGVYTTRVLAITHDRTPLKMNRKNVLGLVVVAAVFLILVCIVHLRNKVVASKLLQAGGLHKSDTYSSLPTGLSKSPTAVSVIPPRQSPIPDTNKSAQQSFSTTSTNYGINPGCVSRKLADYKPIQTATVYHHPPIVHYAWFGSDINIDFMQYVAMLSAYRFLKPERIIVHSNANIGGKYWDLTQKWEGTSVEVNKVATIHQLGGRHVSYVQHQSDYHKLSQVLELGGVASDFDVIIINGTRVQEAQRKSECLLSREGDVVNSGFLSCVQNSSFIRKWLESYHKNYHPELWVFNSANVPTQILKDKDSSVCYNMFLDATICVKPTYAQATKWWLSPGSGVEWRKKTAAHYFMKRLTSHNLNSNNSFGELLRYVCAANYC